MHMILEETIKISYVGVAEIPCDFSYFRDWIAGEQRQCIVKPHSCKALLQTHAVSRLKPSTQRLLRDSHLSRDNTDGEPRIRVFAVDDVIDEGSWIVECSTSRISRWIPPTLANLCNHFLLDTVWMIRLLSGHKGSPVAQSAAVKQSWNPGMNCQIQNLLRMVSASYSNEFAVAEVLPGAFFVLYGDATPPEPARQRTCLFTMPGVQESNRSCIAAISAPGLLHRGASLGANQSRVHLALNGVPPGCCRRIIGSLHSAWLSSHRMAFDVVSETTRKQSILKHRDSLCDRLVFPISNGELSSCCICETASLVTDSSHVHKSNIRRGGNRYRFTQGMTEVISEVRLIR